MTHDEIVSRAMAWLKSQRHRVVLTGLGDRELPDAIGWKGDVSTLVEAKVSRSDFFRDGDKSFRRLPELGMGHRRYYATPVNLLTVSDLPKGWGLVEFGEKRGTIVVRKSEAFQERALRSEVWTLQSALVRATEGWGRKVFGEGAPTGPDGDAGPTMTRVLRDLRKENHRLRDALSRANAKLAKHAIPDLLRASGERTQAAIDDFAKGVRAETIAELDAAEGRDGGGDVLMLPISTSCSGVCRGCGAKLNEDRRCPYC